MRTDNPNSSTLTDDEIVAIAIVSDIQDRDDASTLVTSLARRCRDLLDLVEQRDAEIQRLIENTRGSHDQVSPH